MKKIIKNKKYDTETATLIGRWDNAALPGNLNYISEALYRKRTGEYFIHGEGGARTQYAEVQGNISWTSGEAIKPVTYSAACTWAEQHLGADRYEAEFGVVPEGDFDQVALTVRVPVAAKAALDRECSMTGKPRSEIVAELLATL